MPIDEPILSVAQLTQKIKQALESRFERVQVKGEVSNLRHQASGHLYFTLKDRDAQLSAVLFRGNARQLTGNLPRNGDQVIATGELSVYAPRGNYQLIVRNIEQAGLGQLLLKLHALKKKLGDLGYFDPTTKKLLPKYPQTIGVVTSPTGAVIRDIVNVLSRRFKPFHLVLSPVRVQGEGAAAEIAQAIDDFNRFCLADLIIVGRGGGSLEDLWPFNEECVATAIFQSNIPIISAVGHETDVSIADLAADVRAPTPSAAAEMAVREYTAQTSFLQEARARIRQSLHQVTARCRAELKGIQRHPLFASSTALLAAQWQKLDEITEALQITAQKSLAQNKEKLTAVKERLKERNPTHQIKAKRAQLGFFNERLDHTWAHRLANFQRQFETKNRAAFLSLVQQCAAAKRERLERLISHLQSIDPKALLKKGYCIPFAEKGRSVIMTIQALKEKPRFSLLFHDGKATVSTEEVNCNG
ncbi:MAG: exodeoxyribonuclease VII large subunit [Chlamydiota bacterium]